MRRLSGVGCSLVVAAWLLGTGLPAEQSQRRVVLASTTSLCDTGLLDALAPEFTRQTGYPLKPVCVGSGQALTLGRQGEADVIIAHAPEAEAAFVREGHAELRLGVLRNDFVLVGPAGDPARIRGLEPSAALARVAQARALFITRGDGSGTEEREKKLWAELRVQPAGPWYVSAGQGMAATLRLASEKQAYTLSDRSTFLTLRDHLDSQILVEGQPELANHYDVLVVQAARHPAVNREGARAFAEFLVSPRTQDWIAGFGREKYGTALFIPAAARP